MRGGPEDLLPDPVDDRVGGDEARSGVPPAGAEGPPRLPRLGAVGWLRWMWRQLTSMRVALMLLMLLAVAAVPGSVFPQRRQSPEQVAQYLRDSPSLGQWLDRFGFFDVYASPWFSAVYLLLFISLIGCILPRTLAHARALRAAPPRAPRRFERFPTRAEATLDATPEEVADAAARALRGSRWLPRFRVQQAIEPSGARTVSAERGYLRETGNLLFHLSLVGLLVAVAAGQFLSFRGQAIVIEGRGFANAGIGYDSFESGAGFDASDLEPFTMVLDEFRAEFGADARPLDFTAFVTVTEGDGEPRPEIIRVNHPLSLVGAKIYLQGNGYAPRLTVRDATGEVAFAGSVPFLPQDALYTSRGVVKVPDVGTGPQIGIVGHLLPTAVVSEAGAQSVYPQPLEPLLVLTVWSGDLGLDDGIPQNAYQLDETGLVQATEDDGRPVTLFVEPGQTVDLPDGLGTLTFEELDRFVALDLRHDPALTWVLVFALTAVAGLMLSLFTPRRRVWLRITGSAAAADAAGRSVVTAAALARGDDAGLQEELDAVMAVVHRTDPKRKAD